jgi:hypothetical protein
LRCESPILRLPWNGCSRMEPSWVHPPVVAPWGERNVRFQDPDGMQITLYEVPG